MDEYIANYNYLNSDYNGQGLSREAWIVGSNTQPPNKGPDDLTASVGYGAPKPYQVEFMDIDDLIPQAPGTSYSLIKENDNDHLKLTFTESSYVNHKFDFEVDEAEFRSDETTPKRIEYIELNWNGSAKSSLIGEILTLYIWNSKKWEEVDSAYWYSVTDKTLTATITEDIDDYIDANRMIHVMVGSVFGGSDRISTDLMEVNIRAYNYRAGYE